MHTVLLTRRIVVLIEAICAHQIPGAIQVAELLRQGDCSRRTLYYALEDINVLLALLNTPKLEISAHTLVISAEQYQCLCNLKEHPRQLEGIYLQYVFSPAERRALLCYYFGSPLAQRLAHQAHEAGLTMALYMQQMLGLSKNTLYNDIAQLQQELDAYTCRLVKDRSFWHIEGPHRSRFLLTFDAIKNLPQLGSYAFIPQLDPASLADKVQRFSQRLSGTVQEALPLAAWAAAFETAQEDMQQEVHEFVESLLSDTYVGSEKYSLRFFVESVVADIAKLCGCRWDHQEELVEALLVHVRTCLLSETSGVVPWLDTDAVRDEVAEHEELFEHIVSVLEDYRAFYPFATNEAIQLGFFFHVGKEVLLARERQRAQTIFVYVPDDHDLAYDIVRYLHRHYPEARVTEVATEAYVHRHLGDTCCVITNQDLTLTPRMHTLVPTVISCTVRFDFTQEVQLRLVLEFAQSKLDRDTLWKASRVLRHLVGEAKTHQWLDGMLSL